MSNMEQPRSPVQEKNKNKPICPGAPKKKALTPEEQEERLRQSTQRRLFIEIMEDDLYRESLHPYDVD